MVAVFDHASCAVGGVGAEVDGNKRFGFDFLAPVGKFIDSELIALDNSPGKLQPWRAAFSRTNTVFPVVTGNEVPARPAHYRYVKFADKFDNIKSEAVFIGKPAVRLVDAFIDAASDMLDKGAVQVLVNLSLYIMPVGNDFGFFQL